MKRSMFGIAVVLFLAGSLLLPAAGVLAAPPAPGTSPDTAMSLPAGWTPLNAGQRIWYAFQYAGDNSPVTIDMTANPSDSATFGIWTPGNLLSWVQGNAESPVGRGTVDTYVNGGDMVWAGSFDTPGTYYVVVDQTGPHTGTFMLQISGTGVTSQPGPAPVTLPMAGQPAALAQANPATPANAFVGKGPGTAMSFPGGAVSVAAGQRIWYAFQYAGDNSPVTIDMAANPSDAEAFGVWTADNVLSWQQGNKESPVGRGTVNTDANSDLTWSGSFDTPGTYYVVVDQTGPHTGAFTLTISGSGVTAMGPAK